MFRSTCILATMTMLLLGVTSTARAESASVLLEKGVYAEETTGDLDAAIEIYRQIVDDDNATRKYVAEAYYRLGMCLLKKGDKDEAATKLKRVASGFPDQKDVVAKAKKALASAGLDEGDKTGPPVVVKTSPEPFANDVSPSLNKLSVTFDQKMRDGSWAWVRYEDKYPKITGKPSYDDDRITCSLPVKLEPGHVYWIEFNPDSYIGFHSEDGIAAQRYALVFATAGADGKPTDIPEEMLAKARSINVATYASGEADWGEVPRLPYEVMAYIIELHTKAELQAQQKGLYCNTHIYGVSPQFNMYHGGLMSYRNKTTEPVSTPVHVGNFGRERPDLLLIDEMGETQDYEIRERKTSQIGKYGVWWKPDKPIPPGAYRLLGYIHKNPKTLPYTDDEAKMRMNNHYGSPVLESFFLVLPPDWVSIAKNTEEPTSKARVGGLDIYLWQDQISWNTTHQVDLVLKRSMPATDAKYLAVDEAVLVARQWLKLVDKGEYGDSWDAAAPFFQKAVSKEQWLQQLGMVRKPLGSVQSRKLMATTMTSSPMLTQGKESIIVEFKTNFDNLKPAIETVTPMKCKDGQWRVSGYYIKPGTGPGELSAKEKAEELCEKAWALWRQRKFAEAEKVFKEATEANPSHGNAWQGLGWSQFNQGKPLAAKNTFNKCLLVDPTNPAALNGLGWIAKGQGEDQEAIRHWKKAVEAAPNATAALNGLTQVYMERKEYDKAIKYYKMWLKAEPGNADAKKGLAQAESLSGK